MLIVLCVTGGGYTVSAEVLSDYKELFSLQSASFAYYNSSTGGVSYYYPIGFRAVGNINDKRILCQRDDVCNNPPLNKAFSVGITSSNSSDGKIPTLFRVYIPPGTTSIGFSVNTAPYRVATVISMGTPPEGNSLTKPVSMYDTITATPWLMSDVMSGSSEYWSKKGDGHIMIFDGGGYIDQNILYDLGNKGRWLYVKVVNYDSTWLQGLSFIISADIARYTTWYNSMTEKDWTCFNNPGDSIACSDNTSPTYSVNFDADTGGTISGIASQIVASGNSTTAVTAIPNANYRFVNWTGPNGFISTSNPLTVSNVVVNATYTANFQQQPSVFQCDINSDNKLGLEEVIYILQVLAGLHP